MNSSHSEDREGHSQTTGSPTLFKKRCQKDKDEGNSDCNKPHPTDSWWYAKADKECKSFKYKGCGGNNNRFKSKSLCEKACKKK
uniref:BPTI/Kunitz inhibitor domain-containing protein n=1 Tax=Meloidogyne incognita TaxID=6306 RepID=A0A914MU67_MELIC